MFFHAMNWEMVWLIVLLLGTIVSFLLEKWPSDLTAIAVFSLLVGTTLIFHPKHWPNLNELLEVFSNPAPLTIAAMFILSAVLERSGLIDGLAILLGKVQSLPYRAFIAILVFGVALISAFVNNTVVVVVLMPVLLGLSKQMHRPPSKYLILLSYASIFGGCCTLIGTSTNILASGLLEAANYPPLSMFELAWVGLPAFLFAWVYVVLFADAILPSHRSSLARSSDSESSSYLTEAHVERGSILIGLSFEESGLLKLKGLNLMKLMRGGAEFAYSHETIFKEEDVLLLACPAETFLELCQFEGLKFPRLEGVDLSQIQAREGCVVEGVLGPKSRLLRHSLYTLNRNPLYRLVFLAVRRQGEEIEKGKETRSLVPGDIVLLVGTQMALDNLSHSGDLYLLNKTALPSDNARSKQPLILAVLLGIVLLAAFNLAPILGVMIMAIAFLLVTRTIPLKEAYAAIDWRILSLLYGMLALGMTMAKTGLAHLLGTYCTSIIHSTVPAAWAPYCLLATVYIITMLLTEVLSNNATVMLMGPIAISLAEAAALAPRPFMIAVCIASSAGFMMPTGYQTHAYIYAVGSYRFSDFLKMGWPLNLCYACVTLLLVPFIWPLK